MMGRPKEAVEHIERAVQLEPLHPDLPIWLFFAGEANLELGDFEAALASLQRATALDPRNPRIHAALAASYALSGDADSARRHATELLRRSNPKALQRFRNYVARYPEGTKAHQPRLVEGLRLVLPRVAEVPLQRPELLPAGVTR
jgi:tetratricopeptide (TPR) repeat protein